MRRIHRVGVCLLALCVLSLTACHRINDPVLPEASRLRALGVPPHRAAVQPAAPVVVEPDPVVVTPDPVIVTASEDGPIVTASQAIESPVIDAKYDPANEMTVRGPVLGKRYVKLADGTTAEMVRLLPGSDFMEVLLAPTAYSFRHGIDVGITDHIIVTGTLVRVGNRRILLARELGWRNSTYTLRDADGTPVWDADQANALGLTTGAKSEWRFW